MVLPNRQMYKRQNRQKMLPFEYAKAADMLQVVRIGCGMKLHLMLAPSILLRLRISLGSGVAEPSLPEKIGRRNGL